MLLRCIKSEIIKLKRSGIVPVLIIIPLIAVFMGTGNYYMNIGVLQNKWYSLWTQVSLFYSYFFFPASIALICSYLCKLERENSNWNKILAAPIKRRNIIISKLVSATILICFSQIMVAIFYIIGGKIVGLDSNIPMELIQWISLGAVAGISVAAVQICFSQIMVAIFYIIGGKIVGLDSNIPMELIQWISLGAVAGISVAAVQLFISMNVRSFAVPVGISVCLSILGLRFVMAERAFSIPYSLVIYSMSALKSSGFGGDVIAKILLTSLLFTVIFASIENIILKRKDV